MECEELTPSHALDTPRFSVLIPCFNAAPLIGTTLRTVVKQAFGGVEVIVVDGGSTDGTQAIVKTYPGLETRLVSEPDRGQLDALQKAARMARGDILYWLNADDVLLPGTFTAVDAAFAADPKLELVFSDDFAFDEGARTLHVGGLIKGLSYRDHILFYRQMYSECIFWRRERTRFLPDHDLDLRVTTDYAFFLNLRRGLRERWIPKRLGAFRITAGQASQRFEAQRAGEFARVRKDAWRRAGWSERGVTWRQVLHWPSFHLRQWLRPALHAAVRRTARALDGGKHRQSMTDAFFNDWLWSDRPATPELERLLER